MSKLMSSEDKTKLAALKFLAAATKCKPAAHDLEGFAEACFDDCTVEDLVEGLRERSADKTDCQTWGITPTQWRQAIREALEAKLFYAIEDIEWRIEKKQKEVKDHE